MAFESITDTAITGLLALSKVVHNPTARMADKGSHRQVNYLVRSTTTDDEFTLYVRQNARVASDFSCGLLWHAPGGETLTLVRYNGSSHAHRNRLPAEQLAKACHIHRATAAYIHAHFKPEGFAEATHRYTTRQGALHALVHDCNIAGIQTEPDTPSLF